jgi:hypothetical protein
MKTRAKFKVDEVEVSTDGTPTQIRCSAVVGGSKENEEFFKYTPTGSLSLSFVNDETAKQFEKGKELFVDITLV